MGSKPFFEMGRWQSQAGAVYLTENFPADRPNKRLIEPFAGSAAVSLTLEFDAYLLNDANNSPTLCLPLPFAAIFL